MNTRLKLFVELFWCNNRYTMHTMVLGLIGVCALALAIVIGHPRGEIMLYASLFAYLSSIGMHCVGVYRLSKEVETYDDLYGDQIDF